MDSCGCTYVKYPTLDYDQALAKLSEGYNKGQIITVVGSEYTTGYKTDGSLDPRADHRAFRNSRTTVA